MSITITLPAELEQRILGRAHESRKPVEEVAVDLILQGLQEEPSNQKESVLDNEFMDDCSREADASVTIETVRQILARIPGSISADIIAERAERI